MNWLRVVLQNRGSASAAACGMECGVAAPAGGYPAPAHPALSPTERSPAKSGLHVNFSDKGEVYDYYLLEQLLFVIYLNMFSLFTLFD